ncbi:hypothetical protein PIB30_010160 [Stylosanthes scabra]|uniref:Replication factor A C-terminal domain-containing protein n=1 Tax=Stylosanthes scabra TaxID=79078 RepID=A0ABU6Q5A4_9FABA|nr:hypothetical protein [Stylosanthes scabra]
MGVSNRNYNTQLLINPDLQVANEFRQSVMRSGIEYANVLQIVADPPYSLEDDLLKNCAYKSISQLNNSLENGTFVTLGAVVGIDARNGWWYKSCKQCFTSLKEEENSYHCLKCDSFPTTHVPRYSINLKVADDTETASFLLYDKEATKFICMSTSDLRVAQLTRAICFQSVREIGGYECFPTMQNRCLEDVRRPPMIVAFIEKNKIYEQQVPEEISELLALNSQSEIISKNDSTTPSVNASTDVVDDASGSFYTPKRALFAPQFTKELVDEYPNSAENSSSKTRKVLVAPEDVSVVKVHTV